MQTARPINQPKEKACHKTTPDVVCPKKHVCDILKKHSSSSEQRVSCRHKKPFTVTRHLVLCSLHATHTLSGERTVRGATVIASLNSSVRFKNGTKRYGKYFQLIFVIHTCYTLDYSRKIESRHACNHSV